MKPKPDKKLKRKGYAPNPDGRGGFKPGVSGNPGGRPKSAAIVREALSGHADEMAERLLKLCRTDYSGDARMAAVVGRALEAYFDRIGVGVVPMKPLELGDMTPLPEVSALSDAQLNSALVN